MSDFETENLFGRVAAHEFAGREPELEKICMLAGRNPRTRSAVLLGAPRSGKSELLRQSFDRLFFQAGESAPFYYCLRSDCLTPLLLARDYFAHFLAQFTAFRRTDARLIETTGEPLSSIA
ncbi:MAG TPA: hypothetical protein VEZ90_06850, partial [Blastocatellia bacterium]|nr:hypothetical protein [Blastocatellia bacterium]